MRGCEDERMWRWEDVKMRRCEDERMWRWEGVKMRRCEDVRRCEDEKMRRRWEDEKMWRWEDVKMRRCEDVKMWRWEDVKMRRCEDEKMWRWEDVLQTPTIGRTLRSDALGKNRSLGRPLWVSRAHAVRLCANCRSKQSARKLFFQTYLSEGFHGSRLLNVARIDRQIFIILRP